MPQCVKCLAEVDSVGQPRHGDEYVGLCRNCFGDVYDASIVMERAEEDRREAQRIADEPKRLIEVRVQALMEMGVPRIIARRLGDSGQEKTGQMGAKPWLLLQGVSGSGKTFRAVQILENSRGDGTFIDWPLFLEERKAVIGMRRDVDEPDPDPIVKALASWHLVVDDLGGERQTEYSVDAAQHVFSARYNDMAPTIVTTNLTAKQITERYGKRIASRIFELSEVIEKTKQWRGAA